MPQRPPSDDPYRAAGPAFSESRGFQGVDLFTNPQDLTANYLLQADNVLNMAGMLYVRPGVNGLFGGNAPSSSSSSHSSSSSGSPSSSSSGVPSTTGGTYYGIPAGPSYALTDFDDAGGNMWQLFVANGKIYKTQQDSNNYTEMLNLSGNSYNLNGAAADCARIGNYFYPVDAQSAYQRLSLSGGYPAYAMQAPTQSPAVALTDQVIDTPTAAQWLSPNPQPNATVTTTSSGTTIASGANTIHINTSTYIANQFSVNMQILVNDGTFLGHFTITAKGTGTLTATFLAAPGDSAIGATIASGATVQIVGGILANGAFDVGGGCSGASELVGAPWVTTNGPYVLPANSPDYGPSSCSQSIVRFGSHLWSLLLDNPGDSIGQTVYAPLNVTTAWPATSTLTKCANFVFTAQIQAQFAGSQATLAVMMIAYDNVGDVLETIGPVVLSPSNTSGWVGVSASFNFTQTLVNDPDHYVLVVSSGPKNVGGNGIWVATTALAPLADGPLLTTTGNQVKWSAPYNTIGGSYMVRDYDPAATGTGMDFSSVGILAMPISSGIPLTDLYIRFGFVQEGQTTIFWSNGILFNAPNNSVAYCDITTIPETTLQNVRYLYLQATTDLPETDVAGTAAPNILTFGPLTEAGNLDNQGQTYLYYVTEYVVISQTVQTDANAATGTTATHVTSTAFAGAIAGQQVYATAGGTVGLYTIQSVTGTTAVLNAAPAAPSTSGIHLTLIISRDNVVQSNPSLPSAVQTPTDTQAQSVVNLPTDCPQNAVGGNPTGQYLMYGLWRLGGEWTTPLQVAWVDSRYPVAYGADTTNNPYYAWNPSTRQFLDNTPDLQLSLALPLSFSRDPMPANAQAVACWQGRVWVAVGNRIYGSWLYNSDNSAALMTTLVLNLDDPNYPIAGFNSPVAPDPSDTIVRLIPFGTPVEAGNQFGGGLLILNKRSVWMLQGKDSSDFSLRQYDYDEGVGLIAFRGVARISANQVVFMGPDRLHQFPPHLDSPFKDMGLAIQPALYPVQPAQTLQNTTALSKSWMLFHDARLYLGCPVPGDTANSVVWIYDFRVSGWTRWTGMAVTSAQSEPPSAGGAQYQLFLYGINGQLSLMTGTVDVATPVAAGAAIPFAVTVHAMRPGFFYRYKLHPLFYMWARLENCLIEMMMNGVVTLTAQAYLAGLGAPTAIPGAKTVQTYTLAGGGRPFRMDMPPGLIEGQYITAQLSGSVTDVAYLRGFRGLVSGTTYEQGT